MSRGPTVFESGVENVALFVQNADGAAITSLDHTSAIVIKYRRQDQSTWTTITKVAGTIGTVTSSGFVHDEDGVYQLGLPAAAKDGGNWVLVKWSGTGILTDQMLLPIHRFDHQDADGSSLTNIPDMATLAKQEEIIGDIAIAQTAIDAIPTNPILDTEDGSSFSAIPDMATATSVNAIKAKTDQLIFTIPNQIDANALSGAGGLDASGIRAAIGLDEANLDIQLEVLPTLNELNSRTRGAF